MGKIRGSGQTGSEFGEGRPGVEKFPINAPTPSHLILLRLFTYRGSGNSARPFSGLTRTTRSFPNWSRAYSTRYQLLTVLSICWGLPQAKPCSLSRASADSTGSLMGWGGFVGPWIASGGFVTAGGWLVQPVPSMTQTIPGAAKCHNLSISQKR